MKTAIVTGANGFVGSAVVRELIKNGYSVQALVHKDFSNVPVDDSVEIVEFELERISEIKPKLRKCNLFFHFAWFGSAGSLRGDTRIQLNNAQWTVDALRLAASIGCSRFVCAGSIVEHETFAATQKSGGIGINYIYGGGKLVAHTMAKAIASQLGIDLVWGEITNTYGPGEVSPRLVNTTIRKVLNGETPRFTSGTQNYDFIYIDDLARAFRLIGERGRPNSRYLLGSSTARPLREFLLDMQKSIYPEGEFIFGDIPFDGVNLPLSTFDSSDLERDTGFKAEVSFGEGTKRTKEWLMREV